MNADDFVKKWKASKLKESAAAQTHFNDLCQLIGIQSPVSADPTGEWFVFEKKTKQGRHKWGFADVWRRGKFAWEYKGPNDDLDAALDQLRQYLPALENPKLLVVSDTKIIRVHTNFNDTAQTTYEFQLDDLYNPAKIEQLRFVFEEPEKLQPDRTPGSVTESAALSFSRIVESLRKSGHDPKIAAHFATQLLFCLFAEDIEILEPGAFRGILETARNDLDQFVPMVSELFEHMNTGERWANYPIAWFNGKLFEEHQALPLESEAFEELLKVSQSQWSEIAPAIFGTLFERGMNPQKTSQVGWHYTDPDKIGRIIEPVLLQPLQLADPDGESSQFSCILVNLNAKK